jgi:uncharacterized membrane protein YfcA
MELDEFKAHWNSIQDNQLKQQKYTTEKLDHIIMNTTNTLNELQQKSISWNRIGKIIVTMMIGCFMIDLLLFYFLPNQGNMFSESLLYIAIMIIYGVVTIGIYEWQQQIFTMYDNENLKVTLRKTLSAFKRFYVVYNLIYFVLFPVYYYALIRFILLTVTIWKPSTNLILLISGLLSIISLVGSHLYYKMKHGKKVKSLETNLRELEEGLSS